MISIRVATIGVYGTTEDSFFAALRDFGTTDFVDIRRRRGLRGSLYRYANARYLERRLSEAGIRYQHEFVLAPTEEIRKAQQSADAASSIAKRDRTHLAPEFIEHYRAACLAAFDLSGFLDHFTSDSRVVLFCVEHAAGACHRSIVAAEIAKSLAIEVPDITP